MGQIEIAHEMIKTAATFCKVDAIKFQKRCPKELLTEEHAEGMEEEEEHETAEEIIYPDPDQ